MVKSVCGYCGVGCGLEYNIDALKGNKTYPINSGKVCQKGVSELISMQPDTRLLKPLIRNSINEDFTQTTWTKAVKQIAKKIKQTSKEKIGFYLSGQLLTEDYYIANKLGKGFIGTSNVDTNSRLCMSSAVVAYKKTIGADFVPVRMKDIFDANLLILAGANTAEAHVVFHNHIKKAQKSGLKVVVIDPRKTQSAKDADMHLSVMPGSDIDLFNLISKRLIEDKLYDKEFVNEHINNFHALKDGLASTNTDKMLKRTGLSKQEFEDFFELYKNSQNIITAWTMGLNQSVQGVDKNIALINTHLLTGKIFQKGNGPFSLTGQPNAMGGREVGGLATMLAVHLGFDEQSVKKVSQFWKSDNVANKEGLPVTKMLEADLDVLIICHTDPMYHLPNRHKMQELIKKIPLVVEINAYSNSQTAPYAHIRLPASPWGEKEGCQTNLDRTMTKQEQLVDKLGESKADWEIFQLIAQELGYKEAFDFQNVKEIFNEYKEMTRLNAHMDIYKVDYDNLCKEAFVWGENIHNFLTPDKKGNLFFVHNQELSEQACDKYPFILLTGRTRDQWHSGTKTNLADSLLKYKELNFCEINSDDAKSLGISDGDMIKVVSKRGELKTTAVVTKAMRKNCIFIPISNKEINFLTLDIYDKESMEPDYNHSCVNIIKH